MKSKTTEEVEKYVKVFLEKNHLLQNGKRILAKISKSESEKQKIIEYCDILEYKLGEIIKKEDDVLKFLKVVYKKKNVNNDL